MRKLYTLAFATISFLFTSTLHAQAFKLVKDINAQTNSNPSNNYNIDSNYFALLNGKAYFAADDGFNGIQLMYTDGTPAGSAIVKNVGSANGTAAIRCLYVFNNKIYFLAPQKSGYSQLFQSDGTFAGTKLLKDSLPITGITGEIYGSVFTVFNSVLYFTAGTSQIWKTDGTKAGTSLFIDLNTPEFGRSGGILRMTTWNNRLFILSDIGYKLWISNGTPGGTYWYYGTSAPVFGVTPVNDGLYFSDGADIIKSSGINGPVSRVTFSPDGKLYAYTFFKNELYFIKYISSDSTYRLYKYNPPVPGSAELIKTLNKGVNYSSSAAKFIHNTAGDLLYFVANDEGGAQNLWATDGTAGGTILLQGDKGAYGDFGATGTKLYFSHTDNIKGYELWATDGTIAGTQLIKDINEGESSSKPACITQLGATVVFAANTIATGNELWKTDGTAEGTLLVKDINTNASASSNPILEPGFFDTVNNRLLVMADDGIHGNELWSTDGTDEGTVMTKDIFTGQPSSVGLKPGNSISVKFKGSEYFFARSITNNYALYKTGGLPGNTGFVTNVYTSANGIAPYSMVASNNCLFILLYPNVPADPNMGSEGSICRLYSYTGTGNATLLKDSFYLQTAINGFQNMVVVGNNLYFTLITPNFDNQLWTSDGTLNGTRLITTISFAPGYQSYYTGKMVAYKNLPYFVVNSGYLSFEPPAGLQNFADYLWKSDGTVGGTALVKNIKLIRNSPLIISNNNLYFLGSDETSGEELWVTDGTSPGTHMVKDILPGAGGAVVYGMVDYNGFLYFSADDGVNGPGMWKTDGTENGTVRISNHSGKLVNANGLLYFIENNKIWQSNGTAAGTKLVSQPGLSDVTVVYNLTYAAGRLYFGAYSYNHGYELYTTTNSLLPVTMLSFTGSLQGSNSLLQWVTANEQNNSHFNVQRSLDGRGFVTIGNVNAHGGTKENDYNYIDANVTALGVDKLYYRLQQVDLDGKFTYSKTIALNIAGNNQIHVTPNPAIGFTTVQSQVDMPGAVIKLVDMAGRTLYSSRQNLQAGGKINIPLTGYAKGVYIITVEGSNKKKQEFRLMVN